MSVKHEKYLYLDTETTGVEPGRSGLHHISGIIEIGGKIKDRFDFRVAPFPDDVIDAKALEIGGVTLEQIRAYKAPQVVHKVLTALFSKHVDRYARGDGFTLVGYNIGFDDNMMRAFFKKVGDPYYGSWILPYKIDVYSITAMFRFLGYLPTVDLKQPSVAAHLGITYDAHKSLEDIEACRKIFQWCCKHIVDPAKLQAVMTNINAQIGTTIQEVKFSEPGREDAQQHVDRAGEGSGL